MASKNPGAPKKGEVRNPYGRAGKPKTTNADGWGNVFTLAGTKGDRTTRGSYHAGASLQYQELDDLYAAGGIARRIIDTVAQDATREWLYTDDDKAELLTDRMEEMHLQAKVSEALSMARLHGGSALVALMDDGRELAEPLNTQAVKAIDGFRCYDRWQITWTEQMLYSDPKNQRYGNPEKYRITPIQGTPFDVHESRLVRFDGLAVGERLRVRNNGWNYSYLQPVYQAMMDLDGGHRASASIIQDFVQTVMSIKGLTEMLSSGSEANVVKRLEILDMSRHVLNTLLMDADGEQFSKQSSSVAGLSDLLQAFRIQVSAITGIPMTKLFGISPGGMNATGESDIRNYYDDVANYQKTKVLPPMEQIVRMFMMERSGPYKGQEPPKWSIKFNPLWQMSDKEAAEVRKITAETDGMYIDHGVYTESEVAEVRSQPDGWKMPVKLMGSVDE
jgi:phage-related protein (TIGR01555 family)